MTSLPSRVRLPSIKELTAQAAPYVPSSSPRAVEESFPKPLSPNNYVLRHAPATVGNYDRPIISSTISGSSSVVMPSITQPQTLPANNYQLPLASYHPYPYVQFPSSIPPQPVRVAPSSSSSAPFYYQPVYFQPPRAAAAGTQFTVPEVINKSNNKCHRCGTSETPEWRRGPNGVRTLCNACGLFHAKLVKRKGAALAAEEVLNNKVRKGKNGRRILIRKLSSEIKEQHLPPILGPAFPSFPMHSTIVRP